MRHTLEIDLRYPEDILWNRQDVTIVWVNQSYTAWKWRFWKASTIDLKKYKTFLKEKVEEFRKKENWDSEFELTDTIFYTIELYLNVPETKQEELDQRYLRDVDNFLKPIQDSLETTRKKWHDPKYRIWKNDNQIRSLFAHLKYNENEYNKIVINIYKYDKDKIESLFNFIEKTFI